MSFGFEDFFFLLNQFTHLLDKICLHLCQVENLFCCCTLANSFIHDKVTVTCRIDQQMKQFFLCHGVIILRMTETITSCLKASDCFLEGLFVVLADTHDFTHSTHLGAKLIFYAFELLKSPACKLDNNIITVRNIFVQCTVFAARNILQCQTCCQHRGYKGNRETCGLGSQSR